MIDAIARRLRVEAEAARGVQTHLLSPDEFFEDDNEEPGARAIAQLLDDAAALLESLSLRLATVEREKDEARAERDNAYASCNSLGYLGGQQKERAESAERRNADLARRVAEISLIMSEYTEWEHPLPLAIRNALTSPSPPASSTEGDESMNDATNGRGWWRRDIPRPHKRTDGIPTRVDSHWHTTAEKAITAAMYEVENAGGSVKLTEAITLLSKARDCVADHVEGDNRASSTEGKME